jgi:hypothetical protein
MPNNVDSGAISAELQSASTIAEMVMLKLCSQSCCCRLPPVSIYDGRQGASHIVTITLTA